MALEKLYSREEVLTVFRQKCDEAAPASGVSSLYAGQFLGSCLKRLLPSGTAPEEWLRRLESLKRADTQHVVLWLEQEFPQFVELIPEEFREIFASGLQERIGGFGRRPVEHELKELTSRARNHKRKERRRQ
jgi:hypothetical protein